MPDREATRKRCFDRQPREASEWGDTREVWFIHGGYLYEVTTYKELDIWLAGIMRTWKFI